MVAVDVAVVGSGFGGLTAAALAAQSGLSVVLLEQHTRPGGCAGDFALDGFWFPAGATVITGLEPGGVLRQAFDAIGVEVQSSPLSPSILLHGADGTLPYATSIPEWQSIFAAAYPEAPAGYRRFWDWSDQIGGEVYRIGASLPSLPVQSLADIRRSLGAVRPGAIRTLPYLFKTVGQVKRSLGAVGHAPSDAIIDGLLMDATGAQATNCSAVQGAIALDLYRRGCQWVEGGTGKLAMQLVRAIRARKGEVRFAAKVTALRRVEGGWNVHVEDGETVFARRVIANVPPAALAKLRVNRPSREHLRPDDAWGAFLLHLGIDATGLEPLHPFHQVLNESGDSHDGGTSFVSIFPGRGDRSHRWSISVSTHTRAADWYGPGGDDRRAEMEQSLLSAVERVIPSVRERVVVLRSATPRTFERYTLRPGGLVGGLVQKPSRVALRAPGHRPESRLYLAGDHVFPGQGTVGVALSGINAYRDVCESLGKKPLL